MLNKAIYELVKAGRCWNNKFCDDMAAIGFEHSKADPCVFHKVVDGEVETTVVVHVDDNLSHAKYQATMESFAAKLERKSKLKDMGEAKYYMGYHISRDRKSRELKLDQPFYVKSIVQTLGVEKASRVLASSGVPTLPKSDESKTTEYERDMSKLSYRKALGALLWTATMTRSDIACVVRAGPGSVKTLDWRIKRRC